MNYFGIPYFVSLMVAETVLFSGCMETPGCREMIYGRLTGLAGGASLGGLLPGFEIGVAEFLVILPLTPCSKDRGGFAQGGLRCPCRGDVLESSRNRGDLAFLLSD